MKILTPGNDPVVGSCFCLICASIIDCTAESLYAHRLHLSGNDQRTKTRLIFTSRVISVAQLMRKPD